MKQPQRMNETQLVALIAKVAAMKPANKTQVAGRFKTLDILRELLGKRVLLRRALHSVKRKSERLKAMRVYEKALFESSADLKAQLAKATRAVRNTRADVYRARIEQMMGVLQTLRANRHQHFGSGHPLIRQLEDLMLKHETETKEAAEVVARKVSKKRGFIGAWQNGKQVR